MNTRKYDKLMDRSTFALEAIDRLREDAENRGEESFKDLKIIEKSLSKMWRAIDKCYKCREC